MTCSNTRTHARVHIPSPIHPHATRTHTPSLLLYRYWSAQFHALRYLYLGGEQSNACFIESLARCTSRLPYAHGGRSGASFIKSEDGKLVVKGVTRNEFLMFRANADAYFKYMARLFVLDEPSTLAKVFGVYKVSLPGVPTAYLFVMEYVFGHGGEEELPCSAVQQRQHVGGLGHPESITVEHAFDLKGMLRNRYGGERTVENCR